MTSPLSSLSPRSVDATKLESFDELAKAHPEAATAARQFEAVFLRQLLSCVEKSSGLGEGSETQGAVVGSMVVGALSDEMSAAGGIGLSDIILRAMLQNESAPTPVVPHTEPDEGSPGGPLAGSQP